MHQQTSENPLQETETPMRIGGNVRGSVDGGVSVRVANSDIPSSPFIPSTSPGNTSIRMQDIDLSSPLNYGTPSSMGSIRTPRSGVRGTPIRSRPDIRTDRRIRQVNLGSDAVSIKLLFKKKLAKLKMNFKFVIHNLEA